MTDPSSRLLSSEHHPNWRHFHLDSKSVIPWHQKPRTIITVARLNPPINHSSHDTPPRAQSKSELRACQVPGAFIARILLTCIAGTIGSAEGKATRSTPHQQVLSKFDRRNQAKQRRLAKRATRFKTVDIFSGRNQAPRIVAIVPLCDDVSPAAAVQIINSSLDIDVAIPESGFITVNIEKFRQKIQYVIVGRDLFTALDACRLADFVIFLLSSKSEVDSHGECLMKSVESQGVSNVFAVVEVCRCLRLATYTSDSYCRV